MPSSSDQTRVGRTLTLGGGAESSLEGSDIELSVSPRDIRTSPYDLCANRSDRRQSREGDRWFESTSLQRRVTNEPASASFALWENERGEHLLALVDHSMLPRILERLLSEREFLSPYGVRSVSRIHAEERDLGVVPGIGRALIEYVPGESTSGLFGGNSNWRGDLDADQLLAGASDRKIPPLFWRRLQGTRSLPGRPRADAQGDCKSHRRPPRRALPHTCPSVVTVCTVKR